MIPFEEAPLKSFHRRLLVGGSGGQFSDGFSIGIIGTALSLAKAPLGLTDWWLGALGASSLIGLFFGSLFAGAVADRVGRRPIFVTSMLLFTVFAALQFLSSSALMLFVIRLTLGIVLGCDYVASKAMVTEYAPSRNRGAFLGMLAVAWASGYCCSFAAGFFLREGGPNAWRLALLASAVPSAIAFLLRFRTPESPLWLARKGHLDKARAVIDKYLGKDIAIPQVSVLNDSASESPARLFKPPLLQNLIVGGVFYAAGVIPLFALGTFLPIVMVSIGVHDGFAGAVIYNVFVLVGTMLAPLFIDRMPRRVVLVYGFLIQALLLAILICWQSAPGPAVLAIFVTFAFVMSFAGVLQFMYPAELFPTELRARGIGLTLAMSRFGTATSTFLLPVVVGKFGAFAALGFCLAVVLVAAGVCFKWAPETLGKKLT